MVKQGGRDPHQPIANVAEDNHAIDALTCSMLDSSTSSRQNILGTPTSLGNQRDIPVIPGSYPSGTPRAIGSLNQETSRSEAERLIQEAHQQPTRGETRGRAGYRIQGLGSGSLHFLARLRGINPDHDPHRKPASRYQRLIFTTFATYNYLSRSSPSGIFTRRTPDRGR